MDLTVSKQSVINWLDENQSYFIEMADQIWENPEIAWEEFNRRFGRKD